MFLADYHVHTAFSDDAQGSMEAHVRAAIDRGVTELCFTDHTDDCCIGEVLSCVHRPYTRWMETARAQFTALQEKYAGQITLRFGHELGAPNHDPVTGEKIAADPLVDFIIGSVHHVRGWDDIYYMHFDSAHMVRRLMEPYLAECLETARCGFCSVIGHIGYLRKYLHTQGYTLDLNDYTDQLTEIFKTAVQNGVGIEVNTSGLRCSVQSLAPTPDILRLYRACGGEIITAGSDSHTPGDTGAGIRNAYDALRAAGFRYVTTFIKRKPQFIKL